MNFSEELNKVMNNSVFTYRNCIVEKVEGDFKVLGEIAKNEEELNEIIDKSQNSLGKSIINPSVELQEAEISNKNQK